MQTDKKIQARGSARILERIGQPDTISDDTIKSIIEVVRRNDAEITDWCQVGQPGIDGVCGSFQVQPELAGTIVNDLVTMRGWDCKIEIFPLGVTDPSVVDINVTGGQFAR